MAPLWLIPLLKICCFPYISQHEPLPRPSVYEDLLDKGLIEYKKIVDPPVKEGEEFFEFKLTEKGRVYVEAVTSLPLPEYSWYIPGITKT